MTVWLVGRVEERLAEVSERAREAGGSAVAVVADLTSDEAIRDIAPEVGRRCGGLDVLVHSAGVIAVGGVDGVGVDQLDRQYRTNLRAPYLLTQVLLPLLKRRRGQVLFINSTAGLSAAGGSGPYAATKHGLKAIADSLRDEVNGDGMRVLSVFLGRTATPMQSAINEEEGTPYRPERLIQPGDVAKIVLGALALPRTAEVTDLRVRPAMEP
jgi:NAD(P)-dependent dehydrogenase (short-subunit alcohol dehydrogenase family)